VPLYSGSVHYWRLDPADWRACLEAICAMGLKLVDVYVPWNVHETAPGVLELGEGDPRLDVAAFLRLAHELGLWAIVRPGPHINAELTLFGVPERVLWDPACQARSPEGNQVVLPVLPKMFPVPSYASQAYLDEVTRYFHLLGQALSPLRYPNGPIVLLQIDNEGALYFRDGAFDQDYHPDAIERYRGFLRDHYKDITALQATYGDHARREQAPPSNDEEEPKDPKEPREPSPLRFANALPPTRFEAENVEELPYYLDWAVFQEDLLARSLARFAKALAAAGFDGVPTIHNFPLAQHTTPLNAARVGEGVDMIGYDYYGAATHDTRASIAERSSGLAVRSDALDVPAFACEMGAGFPPYFPPLSEHDSAFTVLASLAYGLRGFNVYMAVERDRWIGAPIDSRGVPRSFAEFWRKLCQALEATSFHRLRRRVPVRLLVPRIERRIERVMHAFGPATGALLSVMGQGARESCLEEELGVGYALAQQADNFARAFASALDARGVPFALVGGEDRAHAITDASWVICASSGGFSSALADCLSDADRAGVRVTLGPRPLERDGHMQPSERRLAFAELVEASDPATADATVARAVAELGLTTFACDPTGVQAAVHEDDAGVARVVFVLNASDEHLVAQVTLGTEADWEDALGTSSMTGGSTRSRDGVLELPVRPRTVRMLARK
jgi:beta-galactosidase